MDAAEQRRLDRKRARQAARRKEILDAAEALARDHGVDGFTAEQLAEALGISQGSVFYYYKGGLDELRAALALREQHRWLRRLTERVRRAPTGIEALVQVVALAREIHDENPERYARTVDGLVGGTWSPELLAEHVAAVNALYDLLEERLEADRCAGRLHPEIEDLRRIAMVVLQLPNGLLLGERMRRNAGGTARHADAALFADLGALVRRGLAAPSRDD